MDEEKYLVSSLYLMSIAVSVSATIGAPPESIARISTMQLRFVVVTIGNAVNSVAVIFFPATRKSKFSDPTVTRPAQSVFPVAVYSRTEHLKETLGRAPVSVSVAAEAAL
jgi:hypothetical protein